jgi:hypothetical protein
MAFLPLPSRERAGVRVINIFSMAFLPLPSRERAGVRVINIFSNACQYAIRIINYFVVPETQYPVTLSLQDSCSLFINPLLLCVLSTIQLNNKLLLRTTEIDDITTHRILTTKLLAMQLACPQT